MESITHRELRNNSALVLRRVAAGESFEVTNHGVVAAHLVPPGGSVLPFEVSRPARRQGRWEEIIAVPLGMSTTDIINAERAERG